MSNSGETPTPGSPPAQPCAERAKIEGISDADIAVIATRTNKPAATWECQRTCTAAQRTNCVQRGCPGAATDILCCPPATGIPSAQTCGGRGATGSTEGSAEGGGASEAGVGVSRIIFPECALGDGKCGVNDVMQFAMNIVRFMFGISGALLLAAFVYAGVEYLIGWTSNEVKSARDRIWKASLGMLIMLFAYSIVHYLAQVLQR